MLSYRILIGDIILNSEPTTLFLQETLDLLILKSLVVSAERNPDR